MRVAVIYDIHGNLPALEAVLREIHDAEVDRVVVGGDVVPGPMPRETIACLLGLKLPVQFIYGNCEIAVLDELVGRPVAVPEAVRSVIQWTASELSQDERELLASWPKTLQFEIPGLGSVLFCHGTPRDENEIFTRRTPEERLAPIFRDVKASVVVCGHTHMQFDRMVGGVRVINAGSVGMPFGKTGADWLLLDDAVERRHTDYDLTAAAERICCTKYIQAEDFASRYVLNPPSEQEMLELFERAGAATAR